MAAIMRRVIVGLALVSSYTMASPVPSDASVAPALPSYPWEILYPGVNDGNIITIGGASLIDNDLIVMANGYKLVHYNIKNATTTVIQSPSDYMYDAWGASKKEVWAVGSMELHCWKGGNGEMPGNGVGGLTGVVLFFNGRTWTKVIDAGIYCTGVSVFARGKDVWIGLVDGSILYSNDGFKTRSIIPYSGRGFDTNVGCKPSWWDSLWRRSQSYYRSIMLAAPDAQGKTYMYAMATDAFLARRQV
ncbi:hypothetical protein BC829DRAFT_393416 [Chytridium lagenaria]|nr:hypothetical protein BC829DRAFT_393416 [Chytridium lagenaria]